MLTHCSRSQRWNEGVVSPILSLYCPVEDEEEEEEDGVGRFLRRCWLYGMPRCADR